MVNAKATGMNKYFWASVFFLIFQWVAAILRVYVRTFIVKKFGRDDFAMLVTLILATGYDVCILAVARLTHVAPIGIGPDDAPFENLVPATHLLVAGETLYIAAASMLKVSLGLLLLRVLVKPWQKITIYTVIGVCCTYGVGYFFVALFACGNPENYLANALNRNCISNPAINGTSYAHAIMNAVADLIFAALPVALLWNAEMDRRSKISVGLILVLGSVGCVFTIVRIAFVHYLSAVSLTYFVTGQPIALTSSGELSIGIVCICLATYKPLVQRWLKRPGYYSKPSRTEVSTKGAVQENQTVSSWRHSYAPSQATQHTQPFRGGYYGRREDEEPKWGPEYRQEFKTLSATASEQYSPRTPSEAAWSSKEWRSEVPTVPGPAHSYRYSEMSGSAKSTRSPV